MPGKIAKTSGIATKRKETDKENRTSKVKKLVSAGKKTVPFDKKPVNSEKTSNENYDKVSKVQTSDKVKSKVLNGSLAETRTGKVFIGYHASSAGGVHNAITHSVNIGAECLALFLRPQRQWAAPPLKPEVVTQWKELVSTHNIQSHLILPHGSYLLNLGSPEEAQRTKSLDVLVEELQRCEELGILLYNIHPGSSCGKISREECVANIAQGINTAHSRTEGSKVKVVLENMSCQGHTIGGDLHEIRQIIDQVEDKTRVGVCLDTCHAMAAGYDLSKKEGFNKLLRDFETIIGWEWLVGCHLNDSKVNIWYSAWDLGPYNYMQGPAGNHRDRHENIGKGSIGVEGFRRIVNCPHFTDIPLILETPLEEKLGNQCYQEEITLLIGLIDDK